MRPQDLNLYLVTDRPLSLGRDMEWIVTQAVEGGVTMVQLREKDTDTWAGTDRLRLWGRNPNCLAALLAEFAKLGYVNGDAAPEVSYTPTGRETRAAEKGIGEYLKELPKDSNDTLSFETDDVEIQAFVRKLKRRRLKKRIALETFILKCFAPHLLC